MRSLYDEIKSPRRARNWASLLPPLTCLAIGSILLGIFWLTRQHQSWMNWIIQHITTPFKQALARLCDLAPFAVGEVIWALVALAALVFLVRTVYLLIRREDRLLRLLRRVLALGACLVLIYCGYTVLWGINYYGDNFSDLSGIETRGASAEELATLTSAFATKLNELADDVPRDDDGVFAASLDDIFSSTQGLYDGICYEFPFLEGTEHQAKRLVSSPLISRLDFTGFFFPFTGEALLNDDAPSCLIPATILHEFAHQRNIAAEDECNFVAILAGLRCGDPVFSYSAALLGFIHLGNALYSVDPQAYWQIRNQLDERVEADLTANNAYWNQFDTKVDEVLESVSDTVYEGFLQSYGQSEGKRSYGKCVDLLVAYYFDYRWA
jgi:hypothetical protein